MAEVLGVNIRISVDTSALDSAKSKVNSAMNEMSKSVNKASNETKKFGESMNQGLNTAKVVAANLISSAIQSIASSFIEATKSAVGFMITSNAQFEQYAVSFEVLFKSADKAKEHMKYLFDFAAKTPFQMPEVTEASKMLETFGLSTKKYLESIGNTASAFGVSMDLIAVAMGRIKSGQFGEAMEQLRRVGISNIDLKAQGIKINKSGTITSDINSVLDAVKAIMDSKYKGMMDKQSQTFNGLMSTMKDNIGQFAREIGSTFFDDLKAKLTEFMDLWKKWQKDGTLDTIKASFAALYETIKQILQLEFGKDFMGKDTGKGIVTAINSITESLKPIYNILKFIQNVGLGIQNVFYGIAEVIVIMGSSLYLFGKILGDIQHGDLGAIKTDWDNITGFMGQAVEKLNKKMVDNVKTMSDNIKKIEFEINVVPIVQAPVEKDIRSKISKWKSDVWRGVIPGASSSNADTSGGGGNTGGVASDMADKIKTAMKTITDSLKSATDAIFKFGDAFQKVTYEKFSPEKLMARTKKYAEEIKKMMDNIAKLRARGVSEGTLQDIQSMGMAGAGLAQGLSSSSNAQLKQITGNLESSRAMAEKAGAAKVLHEHTGTITIKDNNGNEFKMAVQKILKDEITKNQHTYSANPASAQIMK